MMKRPEVEEFKRLTSQPASQWGMADSDVVELCDYILHLENGLNRIASGLDVVSGYDIANETLKAAIKPPEHSNAQVADWLSRYAAWLREVEKFPGHQFRFEEVWKVMEIAAHRLANPAAGVDRNAALEWQPIETAPKGVDVIGLFPDGSVRGMWYFAPSRNTFGWCAVGVKDFKAKPTHWMPRPAAPDLKSTPPAQTG